MIDSTKLEAERKQIWARHKKREARFRAQAERDQKRLDQINRELERLPIIGLLDKPNAVKMACRYPAGDSCHHLNDLRGTITEVRRTRVSVTFENGEKWNMLIREIRPADQEQGFFVQFGGKEAVL